MFSISNHEVTHLIVTYGYWAILIGATVDSFGVPVPGEAMVVSAAVYAGVTHRLLLPFVILAAAAGAVCGDNVSYVLGRQGGVRLLRRFGYLVRLDLRRRKLAHYLFQRYGGRLVVAGRFIPIVHIWTAFLAGTNGMAWTRFAMFNAGSCLAWAAALATAGFLFGQEAVDAGGVTASLAPLFGIAGVVVVVIVARRVEGSLQRRADEGK